MNGLPYDPKSPGGLPWAAKRIQKILEREQREAAQRRRRLAREPTTQQASAAASGSRAAASEMIVGLVDNMFVARWGRGGLLDPALWAHGSQPAVPVAPFGTMGRTLRRADPPPAMYRQAAATPPLPAPFPIPLPLPPVFIPGTPENKEFTDSTVRFYNWLKEGLTGGEGHNGDRFCQARWEAEVARCVRWQGRDRIGCHNRAADRLRKCIRNGGRPDPEEPPEWSDADARGWIDPRR